MTQIMDNNAEYYAATQRTGDDADSDNVAADFDTAMQTLR
jgi:hypothetical protein